MHYSKVKAKFHYALQLLANRRPAREPAWELDSVMEFGFYWHGYWFLESSFLLNAEHEVASVHKLHDKVQAILTRTATAGIAS